METPELDAPNPVTLGLTMTAPQLAVVHHEDGPLLVLAGAGSGKTASIVTRAGRMIDGGVIPEHHLMLTFSKKAAEEMRNRLDGLVGNALSDRMPIRTFHAFGDQFIRAYPQECGRLPDHTVLDEKDQKNLFVRMLREMFNVDNQKIASLDLKGWLRTYSLLAQEGYSAGMRTAAQPFTDHFSRYGIADQRQMNWLWKAFSVFEKLKAEQNVCDFNDLLTLPVRALETNADLSRDAGRRYPYITVDETQDTNQAQYRLIKAIAQHHNNIVFVGDDDQSLYSWRGAHPENLQDFVRDFQPKVLKLEENFRSSQPLVAAASQHIACNLNRMEKQPFSQNDNGPPPLLAKHRNGDMMAEVIVEEIRDAVRNLGMSYSDIAILSRTNQILELLQPHLAKAGIPFEVYGGMKIMEKKEIRLMLSLARLVINPRDQSALQVVTEGLKGLGQKSFEKLCLMAEQEFSGNLLEAGRMFPGKAVQAVMTQLADQVDHLREYGPSELRDALVLRSSLFSQTFQGESKETLDARLNRIDTLQEWISTGLDNATPDVLANPWQAVSRALLEEPDTGGSGGNQITLSTIHKAKGLEWRFVHLAGYSDGLMPYARGEEKIIENPEEERRLSYVALTRAKEVCRLHHADDLFLGYQRVSYKPSPYLQELPHVELPSMIDFGRKADQSYRRHGFGHR